MVAIAARQAAANANVIIVLMIITVALPSLLTSLRSVAISAALEMSQESREDTGRPNLSRVEFPRHGACGFYSGEFLAPPEQSDRLDFAEA